MPRSCHRLLTCTLVVATCSVSGYAHSEAYVQAEFAARPSQYKSLTIAPVVFAHYGYNQTATYTNEEVKPAIKNLSDTICSNTIAGLMTVLTEKNYRVLGVPRALVTKEDRLELGGRGLTEFDQLHRAFGQVSGMLHEQKHPNKSGPSEFQLAGDPSGLVAHLAATDATAILFVDERSVLAPTALKTKKHRIIEAGAYAQSIDYNLGLVDVSTGNLLWWQSGSFQVDAGREARQIKDSIRTLLNKLPPVTTPRQ
jgi:hypothetical protein